MDSRTIILPPPYLRVLTPITIDGSTPKLSEISKTQMYKETHLPVTAKKHLERENKFRANHLQHILEVVTENSVPEIPAEKIVVPDTDIDPEFKTIADKKIKK